MGGCNSTEAVVSAQKTWKPTFPKHKHEGKVPDGIQEEIDYMKDLPLADKQTTPENVAEKRAGDTEMVNYMFSEKASYFDPIVASCDITDFELDVQGGKIKVFCIKPKDLPKDGNACEIHAHGGAAVLGHAEMYNKAMAEHACKKKCVLFNVDYRKAPETKCPGGQQDYATTVEHVYTNAAKYGVNPKLIMTSGVSGGGWICLGANLLLAKANKGNMVKAMFLWTPMISDELGAVPLDQRTGIEHSYAEVESCFKLLANDLDKQKTDDQLYPGRMSDAMLMKMPPFAIFVSEFDFLRKDGLALAERGKKCGKLLDISDLPASGHALAGEENEGETMKRFWADQCLGFDLWVRGKK